MKYLVLVACLVLLTGSEASARTWDVPGDVATIQAGIDSATVGDTVVVACGTYHERGIVAKSGVSLISQTGEATCVTIDAEDLDTVIYGTDLDAGTTIAGFTLTRGRAPELPWPNISCGGGMLLLRSEAIIRDCCFEGNSADYGGGGLCCDSCGGVISYCEFRNNRSGDWGGGVLVNWGCSVTITDCVFKNDSSNAGGGIFTSVGSHLVVSSCLFEQNSGDYGAGIYNNTSSQVEIVNCLLYGNRARLGGGGIGNWNCPTSIRNCTFYGNESPAWGSAINNEYASPAIENCIIANGSGAVPVYCERVSASFQCCDVYGNTGGDWVGCLEGQQGINGNFSACPCFCDVDVGVFDLCDASPCLPGNHPDGYDCGLIGALPVGCSAAGVPSTLGESTTWGAIKAMYK